jgi:acyl carrier protein phosphodiesterase
MNFLAHSLLGFNDSALITGQFCGDFVRGSDLSAFPQGVEKGIRLHRHLDRFTDTHSSLAQCRKQKVPVPGRFAGIVVDVLFDHYLAQQWSTVSSKSLDEHAADVEQALSTHEVHLPDGLKRFKQAMARENILQNNVHLESIERTLSHLSKRSVKFSPLALSVEQLKPISQDLAKPFAAFFPELYTAALSFIAHQPSIGSPSSARQP